MSLPQLPALEIENLRRRANEIRSEWLETTGWKRTNHTPGKRWMYSKLWRGKRILVSESSAAKMQAVLDREKENQK